MKKIVLEKEYTRDYPLIIEQMWDKALSFGLYDNENPHKVKNIYYINDGMMEVWENRQAINWYKEEIFRKNNSDKNWFASRMDEYEGLLGKLENIWSQDKSDSVELLKNFINLATTGMKYFVIFYYTAMDDRNDKKILKIANRIRNKDVFFDKVDNFVRRSIEFIYPQSKGLANTLSIEDVDNMPTREEMEKRSHNFVVDMGRFASIVSLEDFALQNKNYQFVFENFDDNQYVKGQVAFRGYAKGKIKILKKKNKIVDFNEGDILLSPMTTPDFVSAMKKAAAIVTDEGGIVCHAAILARELKIPCVIGTKFATKVFKDGDMVEVDAEKGIIRKI
ncbi:hypothetical protein KKH39_04215 [Patescibacteria group bacterium]|nr:hypothetical protein [Patescibacteria group bacterium]